MTRLSDKRAALEKANAAPQAQEINVFLVTHRKIHVTIDKETGEKTKKVDTETGIERDRDAVRRLIQMRNAGDSRMHDTRVFRLHVSRQGEPTIGDELGNDDELDDDDDD